jgi:hypothetical protein
VEVTLELAHIVGIVVAVAAYAEDDGHGTGTPEILAYLVNTCY